MPVYQRKLRQYLFKVRPCNSWERGLNEHTNGLVPQYFQSEVQRISGRSLIQRCKRSRTVSNARPR